MTHGCPFVSLCNLDAIYFLHCPAAYPFIKCDCNTWYITRNISHWVVTFDEMSLALMLLMRQYHLR